VLAGMGRVAGRALGRTDRAPPMGAPAAGYAPTTHPAPTSCRRERRNRQRRRPQGKARGRDNGEFIAVGWRLAR
jgi:hypothetical protein